MKHHAMDLTSLIEAIPDPILLIDDLKIIHCANQSTEFLFGYSVESLIGKTIELILLEQAYKQFTEYFNQHFEDSHAKVLETCLELTGLRQNQTSFPIALYCSPLKNKKMVLITIKDLSYQTDLGTIIKELKHANNAKDQFLATMNHQLRTPLNAVLGFSEILLLKLSGDLTTEQEKHIGIIHKSGKHLLALINDLSDLAKINSGEISHVIEQLNARELILDVMNTLNPLAEKKKLFFSGKLPNKKINIQSDKRLLTQILTNIINNAIKFTDQGRIFVELMENEAHAFVHVIDTGVGIKEDKMERLFQAFQQLYIAEKKNEGSGLGLHISKKLADLINIELDVFSEYGKGTHFTIIIPKDFNKQNYRTTKS
jgi:protein-histidine pros-kinase